MSKFTPGPWKVRCFMGIACPDCSFADIETAKGTIAHVNDMTYSEDAQEANANLIAAAPELYQIASDLYEELRLIRMKDTDAVYDPTVRVRAEIVFAKVEGRQ
jgi:hypothetical protein